VLETGDVSRNPWLGEVNPVGGPGETSGIYDLEPRAKPGQFKIQPRPFDEQISPTRLLACPETTCATWLEKRHGQPVVLLVAGAQVRVLVEDGAMRRYL
jgi:hypothetical protein